MDKNSPINKDLKNIKKKINNIDANIKKSINTEYKNLKNEKPSNIKPKNGASFIKKSKSKKKKKFALILSVILLAICLGSTYLVYNLISKINVKKIDKDNLSVNSTINEKIINIALFGLDADGGDGSRSDAIMILSIDIKNNKYKLTSILRDSYVKIDGRGMDKINHSYAFGNAELSIKTINENFKMDIQDYISVDFSKMYQIIDILGGVNIYINDQDFSVMNGIINSTAQTLKVKPKFLSKSGTQTLTGIQALAYSRIRHVGNGDYERTERQRNVMQGILEKVMTIDPISYYGLVERILPLVETSIEFTEMIGLIAKAPKTSNLEQYRLPSKEDLDEGGGGKMINGTYYLVYNLENATKRLHNFIENGAQSETSVNNDK